jgi:hypothetical protein
MGVESKDESCTRASIMGTSIGPKWKGLENYLFGASPASRRSRGRRKIILLSYVPTTNKRKNTGYATQATQSTHQTLDSENMIAVNYAE